ncbi:MAG: bifunctional polysaccharide deacetylase/glycosyltransferase family 2 protein [Acidimicrobiia bacterium]
MASGVIGIAVAIGLWMTPMVAAGWWGPSAPTLHLPSIERYDQGAVASAPIQPRSIGPITLPVLAGLGLVAVIGGYAADRRRRRSATAHGGVSVSRSGPGAATRRSRRVRAAGRKSGRWWPAFVGLLLAATVGALVARNFTSGTMPSDHHVDDGLVALGPGTGPVVEIGSDAVRSVHVRPKIVALTFDDGPDPRWTPKVLDVLAQEHVPGTFFVIGEQVVKHPKLVRRVLSQGGELGVHTYRHLEISSQSRSDLQRDLRMTQLAIVGATGHGTALFRPPFITDRSNVGLRQYVSLAVASQDGYVTVLADQDSTDWSRPGAAALALRSIPKSGAGAIIELHDGGGDRAQTVAGLRMLIRALRASGYQFETVSSAARLPAASVMPVRDGVDYWWGRAFVASMRVSSTASAWFVGVMFLLALASLLRMALVVGGGIRHRRRNRPTLADAALPPISVIVAAYNEEDAIIATLDALCASESDSLRVVVVDDGSTDDTARLVEAYPDDRVSLVSASHAGKARALAVGLEHCRAELVVTVDADTQLHPDSLRALVAPFVDHDVGGVSGNLRVARPRGVLGASQQLEYVIGNAFDRRTLDLMGTQVTIPGAAGAYRRSALVSVGGFDSATVAEDTDLTLALVAHGWRIRFAPEALALTSTPTNVRALWRQRSRWSFGITQSVWRHRSMVRLARTRPRAAATWLFVFASQVVLPLAAPWFDLAAMWACFSGVRTPIVVWIVFGLVQFGAAAVALRIEGESLRWLRAYPLHLLGYRQLTAGVVAQTVAWAAAGRIPRWGTRVRTRTVWPTRSRSGAPDVANHQAA